MRLGNTTDLDIDNLIFSFLMKIKIHFLVIFLFACVGCNKNFERIESWEKIKDAASDNRVSYLLQISSDTLDCVECNDGLSRISKELFFKKYLDQINFVQGKEYGYHIENYQGQIGFDQLVIISYSFKKGLFGQENHDYLFRYLKGEKGIRFLGVISVP